MKITLFVATVNQTIYQQARVKSDGLIPVDVRNSGYFKENGARFRMISFLARQPVAQDTIINALSRGIEADDRVIILCDEAVDFIRSEYSRAFFVYRIRSDMGGKTPDNYLRMVLADVLRKFSAYDLRFKQAKYQKLFLLPLENFVSTEVSQLKNIFSDIAAVNRLPSELDRLERFRFNLVRILLRRRSWHTRPG